MGHRLQILAPVPLQLVWHENKTTYLSVKKEGKRVILRIHKLFYDAPTPVLQALIRYALQRDPAARAVIKQMAHLHFSQFSAPAEPLQSAGKVYDLQEIFDRVRIHLIIENLSIGWAPKPRLGKFRSITFGTFDKHRRQIRINPLLDHAEVPLYFLEFIVYHEMLHAVCPARMDAAGRCSVHTREFREKERQFPHFGKAKEWEKTSLIFFKKRKSHGRA